ncbi:hypothetical protein FOL47_008361 [Perkinsus chesapeaki]|uniref:RRM domain-containing protein n=1 Tax=Perkinsus chesapeaki TaxID=330153 RepID=A0A7J6LEN9_PERCH|nr:hypothetical protein FOL47_008361 [Perkinsus chesapeaki]
MYSRTTLYVGNISSHTTEQDIRDEFSDYGRVIRCYIPRGKNICFIEFDRERDAEDAHRGMSRAKIGGVSVTVEWAKAGPRYQWEYLLRGAEGVVTTVNHGAEVAQGGDIPVAAEGHRRALDHHTGGEDRIRDPSNLPILSAPRESVAMAAAAATAMIDACIHRSVDSVTMASVSSKSSGVPCGSLFLALTKARSDKESKDALEVNKKAFARLGLGMDAYYSQPKFSPSLKHESLTSIGDLSNEADAFAATQDQSMQYHVLLVMLDRATSSEGKDECAAVLRDLITKHDLIKRTVDCCAIEELPEGCRDTLREQAATVLMGLFTATGGLVKVDNDMAQYTARRLLASSAPQPLNCLALITMFEQHLSLTDQDLVKSLHNAIVEGTDCPAGAQDAGVTTLLGSWSAVLSSAGSSEYHALRSEVDNKLLLAYTKTQGRLTIAQGLIDMAKATGDLVASLQFGESVFSAPLGHCLLSALVRLLRTFDSTSTNFASSGMAKAVVECLRAGGEATDDLFSSDAFDLCLQAVSNSPESTGPWGLIYMMASLNSGPIVRDQLPGTAVESCWLRLSGLPSNIYRRRSHSHVVLTESVFLYELFFTSLLGLPISNEVLKMYPSPILPVHSEFPVIRLEDGERVVKLALPPDQPLRPAHMALALLAVVADNSARLGDRFTLLRPIAGIVEAASEVGRILVECDSCEEEDVARLWAIGLTLRRPKGLEGPVNQGALELLKALVEKGSNGGGYYIDKLCEELDENCCHELDGAVPSKALVELLTALVERVNSNWPRRAVGRVIMSVMPKWLSNLGNNSVLPACLRLFNGMLNRTLRPFGGDGLKITRKEAEKISHMGKGGSSHESESVIAAKTLLAVRTEQSSLVRDLLSDGSIYAALLSMIQRPPLDVEQPPGEPTQKSKRARHYLNPLRRSCPVTNDKAQSLAGEVQLLALRSLTTLFECSDSLADDEVYSSLAGLILGDEMVAVSTDALPAWLAVYILEYDTSPTVALAATKSLKSLCTYLSRRGVHLVAHAEGPTSRLMPRVVKYLVEHKSKVADFRDLLTVGLRTQPTVFIYVPKLKELTESLQKSYHSEALLYLSQRHKIYQYLDLSLLLDHAERAIDAEMLLSVAAQGLAARDDKMREFVPKMLKNEKLLKLIFGSHCEDWGKGDPFSEGWQTEEEQDWKGRGRGSGWIVPSREEVDDKGLMNAFLERYGLRREFIDAGDWKVHVPTVEAICRAMGVEAAARSVRIMAWERINKSAERDLHRIHVLDVFTTVVREAVVQSISSGDDSNSSSSTKLDTSTCLKTSLRVFALYQQRLAVNRRIFVGMLGLLQRLLSAPESPSASDAVDSYVSSLVLPPGDSALGDASPLTALEVSKTISALTKTLEIEVDSGDASDSSQAARGLQWRLWSTVVGLILQRASDLAKAEVDGLAPTIDELLCGILDISSPALQHCPQSCCEILVSALSIWPNCRTSHLMTAIQESGIARRIGCGRLGVLIGLLQSIGAPPAQLSPLLSGRKAKLQKAYIGPAYSNGVRAPAYQDWLAELYVATRSLEITRTSVLQESDQWPARALARGAHCGELAGLEEASLVASLLRGSGKVIVGGFSYAALLTQDADTMYPKSRVEKLQGRCDIQTIFDDEVVTVGANPPSIYTQRVYWLCLDIIECTLLAPSPSASDHTFNAYFESLLDCIRRLCDFVASTVCSSESLRRSLLICRWKGENAVPLSLWLCPQSLEGKSGTSTAHPPTPKVSAAKARKEPLSPLHGAFDEAFPRVQGDSSKNGRSPLADVAPHYDGLCWGVSPLLPREAFVAETGAMLTDLCPTHVTVDEWLEKCSRTLELAAMRLLALTEVSKSSSKPRAAYDVLATVRSEEVFSTAGVITDRCRDSVDLVLLRLQNLVQKTMATDPYPNPPMIEDPQLWALAGLSYTPTPIRSLVAVMERMHASEVVMIRELLEDERFRGIRDEDKFIRVVGEVLRSENIQGARFFLLHDRGSCIWADLTELWRPFEHMAVGSWVTVIGSLRPGLARAMPEDLNLRHPQLFTTQQCLDEAGLEVPVVKVGLVIPCAADVVDMNLYERCVRGSGGAVSSGGLIELGAGEVLLDISEQALRHEEREHTSAEGEAESGVMTPIGQFDEGPDVPPCACAMDVPCHEMEVIITTPEYIGVPRGGFLISNSAKRVASVLLTDPEPSPVFSFRDKVPDPSKSDFLLILSSIRRRGPAIHMLSLGEVTVLGKDIECMAALVDLLKDGYIYACDFGELRFTTEIIRTLLAAIRGEKTSRPPPTNLAFVFLDAALGLTNTQIQDIKETTKRRRSADKKLLPQQVDRLHGAWLMPECFEWVMASENLTRCFWRPYQERLFWERMGFKVPMVKKGVNDPKKWVNYYVQELTKRFHRGNINASMLDTVGPEDRSYLDECIEQWSRVSLPRMKARLRPSSGTSSGHPWSESPPPAKRAKLVSSASTSKLPKKGGSSETASSVGPSPRISNGSEHEAAALRKAMPKSGGPSKTTAPISLKAAQAAMVGEASARRGNGRVTPTAIAKNAHPVSGAPALTKKAAPNPRLSHPPGVGPVPATSIGRATKEAPAKPVGKVAAPTRQVSPAAAPIQGMSPCSRLTAPSLGSSRPSVSSKVAEAGDIRVQASGGLSESEIRKVMASQLDIPGLTKMAQFSLKAAPPPPPRAVTTAKASTGLRAAAAKSKPSIDIPGDDHSSSGPPTPASWLDDNQSTPGKMGAIATRLAAINKTPTASSDKVPKSPTLSAQKSPVPRGRVLAMEASPSPVPKLGSLTSVPRVTRPTGAGPDVNKRRDTIFSMVAQGIQDLRSTFPDGSWATSKERETLKQLLELK